MKTRFDSLKNMLDKKVNFLFECYLFLSIFVTFIGRVTPVKQMLGAGLEATLYNVLAVLGGVLWMIYWLVRRDLIPMRYLITTYAFIFVMFVSSVLNRQYGIFDNIKTIIWTVVQMGVIFVYPKLLGKERIKKLFFRIWEVISFFWFFPVFQSLIQFFQNKSYWTEADPGRWIRQGFTENRLFGIFNDPNYAAITSLCVIIVSFYLWKIRTNKIERVLLAVNFLLQVIYIRLSGSRTVLVCMVIALILGVLLSLKNMHLARETKMKWTTYILVPVVVVALVISVNYLSGALSLNLAKAYQSTIGSLAQSDKDGASGSESGDNKVTQPPVSIDRTDTSLDNISNNRTTIWKAYLSLMDGDYLFGGSPRNFAQKWIDKNPTGYLAQTKMETHNGYLSVLVGTGLIGTMCIAVFIFFYLKDLFKVITDKKAIALDVIVMEMLLCAFVAYIFFFTDLFFIHSLTSVLFWFLCGASLLWLTEK